MQLNVEAVHRTNLIFITNLLFIEQFVPCELIFLFNIQCSIECQIPKNIYSLPFCINLNICSFYMLHTIFQHLSCRCAIFAHNIFLFSASSMENKSVTIEKETLTRTYFKRKEKKLPNMNEKIRSKIFLSFKNKINYGYLSHCFHRIFFLQNKVKVVLKLEIST